MSYREADWGRPATGLPRDAFRPSGVFLAVLALFVASGAMTWTNFGSIKLDVFLFVVSGWVLSLCLHEYAHAITAYRGGDTSVAHRGYLTLNPLKYTHPLLSIVLPVIFIVLGGIGLPGGAVWVDRHAVRGRVWDSLISFAGPAVNMVFTLALIAPFWFVDVNLRPEFWAALAFLAFLELTASVLNLLPVPGLDGGNLIQPWLPPQWQRGFATVAPYGMLLLFALLWQPQVNRVFFGAVFFVGDLLGLDQFYYALGYELFRFWT